MSTKLDVLINSIFEKFEKYEFKKINLKKKEFKKFIIFLLNES